MKEIFVAVLVCAGTPEHPAEKANYSLALCQEDGRDWAIQYFVLTGKRCSYKCVKPNYEPPEIKQ